MIRVRNLMVAYGNGTPAVNGVTLAFPSAQVSVLLGPSGAGKSSLLRSLNGLVRPASGIVSVDGFGSIFANRESLKAHRQKTAMVFQQHHLIGRLSAMTNVLTGRLAYASRMRAIIPLGKAERLLAVEALDRVGLIDKAFERADRLSGGQQQRVGIARALVQRPSLLLADEPVASLDPASADAILVLLEKVTREDGITLILSLHQVELALRFADTIVGLNQGRVVFEGPPAALDSAALARIYAAPERPSGPPSAPGMPPLDAPLALPETAGRTL